MVKKFTLPEFGYEVQIGKFAAQADGAVWLQRGGTVVLSTACQAPQRDFPGFLPLSVDYRESFSAAGKIPGGYFKREGKYSDKEVLTSRLIDRALRPLFPDHFFNQIQVLTTVYSVDRDHSPNTMSLLSSSLALCLSQIPFFGPVGVVEIVRVDGNWIFNPSYPEMQASPVRLVIAGTVDGICMLEGSADGIVEHELLELLKQAHVKIKTQISWQEEICREMGIQKTPFQDATFDWATWGKRATEFYTNDKLTSVCVADKKTRSEVESKFATDFLALYQAEIAEITFGKEKALYALDHTFKALFTDFTMKRGKRVDGRDFNTVRNVSVETALLPFVHGSALFQRGETQALVSTTLGGGQDEQRIEDLMAGDTTRRFLLHYNFPPFSVGEVKPMRGPGRREVGHGALAASAVASVLPTKEQFPYTIRVIADILESSGSSSMATVCGTIMSLMDAGVPIQQMVSGVAMGLFKSTDGKFQVITDLSGFEDEFGWMDFKVAGTDAGITAIQMDIKNKGGLPWEVFEAALEQAKHGRAEIMAKMRTVLSKPKAELSSLVPKIISFKINTNKIGAVIGTGGKIIREIIEKTGTTIDIADDGTVNIFGHPGELLDMAVNWVKTLAGNIEEGAVYIGKVRRHAEFGMFVELVPGQDGLLHISAIPKAEQRDLETHYPLNSDLPVEVVAYDATTGRIRLKIAPKQD